MSFFLFFKVPCFSQNVLAFCKMSCFSLLPQDLSQSTSCPVISSSHGFLSFSVCVHSLLIIFKFEIGLVSCDCNFVVFRLFFGVWNQEWRDIFFYKNEVTDCWDLCGERGRTLIVHGRSQTTFVSQSPPAREHCFLCVVNHFASAPIQSLKSGDPFL